MATNVKGVGVLTDSMIQDAWLRAEALCECRKGTHGHAGRCGQFLIWAERGEVRVGGWEARRRDDPRLPACEILCAACYAKSTGRAPMEPDESS